MEVAKKQQAAVEVARRLRGAGYEALFAGGCVRDRLLGLQPGDFDVATSARPEEVRKLFPRNVAIGAHFGVILVIELGVQVEVATFRTDVHYVDGRRPESVRFATLEEDASRRDFTVNGMFEDPESGEVIDHVGGCRDLAAGVIRAIGDPAERFREDRLRLIRATRFAARLGFRIDPETFAAVRKMAPGIHDVSKERIGDEIVKMLTRGTARSGFELLDATGLLAELLPEMIAFKGVAQGTEQHPEGDVFMHTTLALEGYDHSARREALAETSGDDARHCLEALGFAVLLHDVSKPECLREKEGGKITFYGHCEKGAVKAVEILRRLRRPKAVADRAAALIRDHLKHLDAPKMRTATLKKFLRRDWIEDLLELCRIDAIASSGHLEAWEFCRKALDRIPADARKPAPLMVGDDLIGLGHRPGPRFREILSAVEDAQLEGELASREVALAFVRDRFPPD